MAKKYKMALVGGLLGVYRALTGLPRPAGELRADSEFRSIVIYSTTALGDLMFNTPAIHQLRLRYPSAHITLIVHQKFADLVCNYPDIDEVLCWDGKFSHQWGLVRQLRARRPDLAVILHSRAPHDVMTAVFAGVRHILRDDLMRDGYVPMARWLSGWSEPGHVGHVIQRKLSMLSVLGCRIDDTAMRVPCVVDRLHFAVPGRVRIGLQLGTSTPERRWPVERFAALADALLRDDPACSVVLLGVAQEAPLASRFLDALPEQWHRQVDNMIGQTSITQAFDLVASLDLLVTGDTGPLHLAIALQVPTVSLFATANPAETGPCQDMDRHRVIHCPLPHDASAVRQDAPMTNITVDSVLAAVRRILSKRLHNIKKESQ
jgi:ADP-heptose:LPS heptosyltransferase